MKAVQKQSIESLQAALDMGANPNYCREADDMTPLMLACQKGWYAGIKILLEAGSNASRKNSYGQTALMIAAASCSESWKE